MTLRLLLVPQLTELEWVIKPQLEEWAEVASYDAPGVGGEPESDLPLAEAVALRGLEEMERRGWDGCVVVADEFGASAAARLASARREVVDAIALGHARLYTTADGERPTLNREVLAAAAEIAKHDLRTFVRQLFLMTRGETSKGGYSGDLVDSYIERVPAELVPAYFESADSGIDLEECLRSIDAPMLLVQHRGCLLYTDEGFEDAIAAFPQAQAERLDEKPSTSPAFADLLRSFCEQRVAVQ